jgi:hypothetical protein
MKWKWIKRILLIAIGLFLLLALFGEEIGNWFLKGRTRQRQAIIDSYNREAAAGKVPIPALIQVTGVMSGKFPIEVKVKTSSGETQSFEAENLNDGSGTNWGFVRKVTKGI